MLAIRKTEPGFGLQVTDVPEPPAPGPGEVRVEVAAAGICGSDIHAYEWTSGYEFMTPHMPMTIGHEFSGTVLAAGPGVTDLRHGNRVVVWPVIGCGQCRACRSDRRLDCPDRLVVGLHRDGGFAMHVNVPADCCFLLPDSLDLTVAALTEPFCVAQNAVEIADLTPDDVVLVLGPGPIGLAIAWLAQHAGAKTLLVGLDSAARLDVARRMGIRHLADLREESLSRAIDRVFGRPVDRVLEATGAVQSIHDGLDALRSSGILVVVGIHSRPLELDLTRFVRRKLQMRAAHDSPRSAWQTIVPLLAAHGGDLRPMITHELPLNRALDGFELARRGEAAKVILHVASNS